MRLSNRCAAMRATVAKGRLWMTLQDYDDLPLFAHILAENQSLGRRRMRQRTATRLQLASGGIEGCCQLASQLLRELRYRQRRTISAMENEHFQRLTPARAGRPRMWLVPAWAARASGGGGATSGEDDVGGRRCEEDAGIMVKNNAPASESDRLGLLNCHERARSECSAGSPWSGDLHQMRTHLDRRGARGGPTLRLGRALPAAGALRARGRALCSSPPHRDAKPGRRPDSLGGRNEGAHRATNSSRLRARCGAVLRRLRRRPGPSTSLTAQERHGWRCSRTNR